MKSNGAGLAFGRYLAKAVETTQKSAPAVDCQVCAREFSAARLPYPKVCENCLSNFSAGVVQVRSKNDFRGHVFGVAHQNFALVGQPAHQHFRVDAGGRGRGQQCVQKHTVANGWCSKTPGAIPSRIACICPVLLTGGDFWGTGGPLS